MAIGVFVRVMRRLLPSGDLRRFQLSALIEDALLMGIGYCRSHRQLGEKALLVSAFFVSCEEFSEILISWEYETHKKVFHRQKRSVKNTIGEEIFVRIGTNLYIFCDEKPT